MNNDAIANIKANVLAVLDDILREPSVGSAQKVARRQATFAARTAVAELLAEHDRLLKTLAWNLPVVWVLRSDDPDPQYDFAVGRDCPSGWEGKASPLYDGQGMRPVKWQVAVAELIETMIKVEAHLSIHGHDDPGKDGARIVARDAVRAALARVQRSAT